VHLPVPTLFLVHERAFLRPGARDAHQDPREKKGKNSVSPTVYRFFV